MNKNTSYRKASETNWTTSANAGGYPIDNNGINRIEVVNAGSLQRIADAAERQAESAKLMASNYLSLQADKERYQRWYREELTAKEYEQRRNASLRGVITRQKREIERLKADLAARQAFKDFVHQRLDEIGIETHPDGEHSKAGCRIGDRLDIVAGKIAR